MKTFYLSGNNPTKKSSIPEASTAINVQEEEDKLSKEFTEQDASSETPRPLLRSNPPITQTPKLKFPKNFFKWYESLNLKQKLLFLAAISIVFGGAIIFIFYAIIVNAGRKEPIKLETTLVATVANNNYYSSLALYTAPSVPRDQENPINGELYTLDEMTQIKSRPPLAVMIENHTSARPQSGLNKADVVYEALAEGGITRFMGIFWGKSADELGPVRSARQYYVELLSPYDAIYMHIGGANTDDPKTDAISNIYKYGIHSLDTQGSFYRISTRKAPHNAYTSTKILWDMSKARGWTNVSQIRPWLFKKDDAFDKRGLQTTADIRFLSDLANGGDYDVLWTYDRNTNLYYRKNGGADHLDKVANSQYSAKNVIVQETQFKFAHDTGNHVIYEVIGSGKATVLLDGKVIIGTWEKLNRKSRTIFKNEKGEEIKFNRGQIWVEVVPKGYGTLKINNS